MPISSSDSANGERNHSRYSTLICKTCCYVKFPKDLSRFQVSERINISTLVLIATNDETDQPRLLLLKDLVQSGIKSFCEYGNAWRSALEEVGRQSTVLRKGLHHPRNNEADARIPSSPCTPFIADIPLIPFPFRFMRQSISTEIHWLWMEDVDVESLKGVSSNACFLVSYYHRKSNAIYEERSLTRKIEIFWNFGDM